MLSSQDVQSQLSRQACLLALLVPKCIVIIQKLIRGKKKKDANIGNYQVSFFLGHPVTITLQILKLFHSTTVDCIAVVT